MTKVFNAKLLVNFVYYGVSGLAGSLIIAIGLKTPFLYAALITLNALFIAALGGNMGLLINILLPKMKWENENQIVKQSAAVFLTVLAAFIFAALLFWAGCICRFPRRGILQYARFYALR